MWLDLYRLLQPVLNFILLLILIGLNSVVRNEYSNGVLFLILIFLILISGTEPTVNFFGASVLPLFIILHLAVFSFNSLSLIMSFITFVVFKKNLERNLLGPISIYLLFDTFFYYVDIGQKLNDVSIAIGKVIFTFEIFVIIMIIPIYFLYLTFERILRSRFKIFDKHGIFLINGVFIYFFSIAGFLLNNSILLLAGTVLLIFYFVEVLQQEEYFFKHLLFLISIISLYLFNIISIH